MATQASAILSIAGEDELHDIQSAKIQTSIQTRSLSVPSAYESIRSSADQSNSVARSDSEFDEKGNETPARTTLPESSAEVSPPDDDSDSGDPSVHRHGIYWRSPVCMVGFLVIGILAAMGHHLYYCSMSGEKVGIESKQQWALRFGTAFAYITQISLVASVGVAYTQWLWRTLKRTEISIEGLDAAFDADATIISLLNKEVLWKIKVGALLALICWCLQLPSLVTPATLSVIPIIKTTVENAGVASLDLYGKGQQKRLAYWVSPTENEQHLFLGPRTILARLSTATATQGQILSINPPFPNSSYTIQFHGPAVQCEEANLTVSAIIEGLRNESIVAATSEEFIPLDNYYYAFIPDLINFGNGSLPYNGVQTLAEMRFQEPTNASNQLWMVYSRYVHDSTGSRVAKDYYSACQLYNASYSLNLTFEATSQIINTTSMNLLNVVQYPDENAPATHELDVQQAYSAFMVALSNLLVGSMGTYNSTPPGSDTPPTTFSEITTQIEHTSLLGSQDLNVFFDRNRAIWTNNISDQRREDIDLARNRTLDVLIEEVAFNITMSLMSSDLISPPVIRQVTVKTHTNVYSYNAQNLFISYGLAIFFALFANILGAFAFKSNQASHTRSFSAIMASTRHKKLVEIFHSPAERKYPLKKRVREIELKFGFTEKWGWGFVKVGDGTSKLRKSSVAV